MTREALWHWAKKAPVIAGKLGHPAWACGDVTDRFSVYGKNTDVGSGTRTRLAWTHEALSCSANMIDAELRAFGTRCKDRLWLGDVFELFLKFRTDRHGSYEFQANPRSVILELFILKCGLDFATLAGPGNELRSRSSLGRSTGRTTTIGVGPSRAEFPGRHAPDRGSTRTGSGLAVRPLPLRL